MVNCLQLKRTDKVSEQREYHRKVPHRESSAVEDDRKVLWEWVCEMRSEIIVADAVSSRYRGKISCVSD